MITQAQIEAAARAYANEHPQSAPVPFSTIVEMLGAAAYVAHNPPPLATLAVKNPSHIDDILTVQSHICIRISDTA